MNAVIYARYSSNRQRDESIEDQLRVCNAFARHAGLAVVGEYADHAMTGRTADRPQFQRMIADAASGQFAAVIVYKLDRFARDRYDSSHYKRILKKAGVRVMSATEAIPDTPEGIIMESLMEGMAEWYSANLAQNVKRGLMGNAEKCKTNGVTIFGYRTASDGTYEADPVTGPYVSEAFLRRANGQSQSEIAEWLNREGVKTTRGRLWTATSVDWLLKNDKYTGLYHFSGFYKDGGMPALVSEDVYYRVSTMKARRKNMTTDLPLRKKAFCQVCGSHMVGTAGTSQDGTLHHYYRCAASMKGACGTKAVSSAWLDGFVRDRTIELLYDEQALEAVLDALERHQSERAPDDAMLKGLEAKKRDCDRKAKNIMRAIEDKGHDAQMLARLDELRSESAALADTIEAKRETSIPISREVMEFFIAEMRIKARDKGEGKTLLDAFIGRVEVSPETVIVHYNFRQANTDTPFYQEFSVRRTLEWSG